MIRSIAITTSDIEMIANPVLVVLPAYSSLCPVDGCIVSTKLVNVETPDYGSLTENNSTNSSALETTTLRCHVGSTESSNYVCSDGYVLHPSCDGKIEGTMESTCPFELPWAGCANIDASSETVVDDWNAMTFGARSTVCAVSNAFSANSSVELASFVSSTRVVPPDTLLPFTPTRSPTSHPGGHAENRDWVIPVTVVLVVVGTVGIAAAAWYFFFRSSKTALTTVNPASTALSTPGDMLAPVPGGDGALQATL
jgi:hypothetical protein